MTTDKIAASLEKLNSRIDRIEQRIEHIEQDMVTKSQVETAMFRGLACVVAIAGVALIVNAFL